MISAPWPSWAPPLLNHLWQSTVFAAGVWLLTLVLRRNAARVRYRLWMAASLKFLIPFSLLIAVESRLPWPVPAAHTQPAIAAAVEGVTQPLLQVWPPADAASPAATATPPAPHAAIEWLPLLLLAAWTAGTLLLLARWVAGWLRLQAVVRRGEPVILDTGTPALLVAADVEPGVFGIFRPVLVLPRGIADRLSAQQMDAIVAHELCHMRRRDNLTAALHMAVEALFWFHPLVWWLRARLVEERERACDEAVLAATRQPFAYAEGILNVCRFYVEAPLSCVSGVTGSELKQRIARILANQNARQLDLQRKTLLALACVLAVGLPVVAGVVRAAQGQTPPAQKNGIVGIWQGTARTPDGRGRRIMLKVARDAQGKLSATLYNLGDMPPAMEGDAVSFEDGTLRFTNQFPGLTFEGRMSADGNSISGTVTRNGSFPLVLERTTPDTAWTLPTPPPRIPAMAPDAHPTFEVATIKPTPPDERRRMFSFRGTELVIKNMSLHDLLKFVYQLQNREIAGEPNWVSTERWDIEAKPDTPGMASPAQMNEMIKKLLADRFALRSHDEQREMAAYALEVGKNGPKLTVAKASVPTGFSMGPLGVMHAGGATMDDLAHVLQGDILDRPVVDKTGLHGRWNFTLQWTPDESQFPGVKLPRPAADDSPYPPLFTAIQEQLGLRLEPLKLQVPVLVIDRVAQPTPN